MVEAVPQSQARLTKFIRLMVYSYLTFEETVAKAALLSKKERAELKESEIARADKVFKLKISPQSRPDCLLSGDLLT